MQSPLAEIVQALDRGDRTCNTIYRKSKSSGTRFYFALYKIGDRILSTIIHGRCLRQALPTQHYSDSRYYSKGLGTRDWVKSLFVSKFYHLLMS